MVLLLAIGDLHIPHLSVSLPPKLKKLLVPGKIDQVLCTGNLGGGDEGYEYLRGIGREVHVVSGEMDEGVKGRWGRSRVVEVGRVRVGLVSAEEAQGAHRILNITDAEDNTGDSNNGKNTDNDNEWAGVVGRRLGVDVIVFGGKGLDVREADGRLIVRPGSGSVGREKSFVLLDVDGLSGKVTVYMYALGSKDSDGDIEEADERVRVEKTTFVVNQS